MRKVLLATAAFAIVGAGSAVAADNSNVAITATVSAECTMTDPDPIDFGTDPSDGAVETSNFEFTCNFAGDGGESALTVTFESDNGGLTNPGDTQPRVYTVAYDGNAAFTSTDAQALPVPFAETSTTANVAEPRSFDVTLDEDLPVAGSYSDTLFVSIAP